MTSPDDALARSQPLAPAPPSRPARGNIRTFSRSGRSCVRPGCPAPAESTLVFRYEAREAELLDLTDEPTPATYDLCDAHAGRTGPPHGWSLADRRSPRPDAAPRLERPDETVALLAAALGRGGPDADQGSAPTGDPHPPEVVEPPADPASPVEPEPWLATVASPPAPPVAEPPPAPPPAPPTAPHPAESPPGEDDDGSSWTLWDTAEHW